MDIVTILITAIGLSMDTFAVSLSNGMCLKKIKFSTIVTFGLFFGISQGLMPVIGYFLGRLFSDYITAYDHWVAFGLLAFLGGKLLWEGLRPQEEAVCSTDENIMSFKNLSVLALATSVDAMAIGIVFATSSQSGILVPALIIGCITFVFSGLGVILGNKVGNFFQNKAEIFGGSILIIIGIKILVEHLFFS